MHRCRRVERAHRLCKNVHKAPTAVAERRHQRAAAPVGPRCSSCSKKLAGWIWSSTGLEAHGRVRLRSSCGRLMHATRCGCRPVRAGGGQRARRAARARLSSPTSARRRCHHGSSSPGRAADRPPPARCARSAPITPATPPRPAATGDHCDPFRPPHSTSSRRRPSAAPARVGCLRPHAGRQRATARSARHAVARASL